GVQTCALPISCCEARAVGDQATGFELDRRYRTPPLRPGTPHGVPGRSRITGPLRMTRSARGAIGRCRGPTIVASGTDHQAARLSTLAGSGRTVATAVAV